jgi:hypothetical protein
LVVLDKHARDPVAARRNKGIDLAASRTSQSTRFSWIFEMVYASPLKNHVEFARPYHYPAKQSLIIFWQISLITHWHKPEISSAD